MPKAKQEDIENDIKEILASQLYIKPDKISNNTRLQEDLGVDSFRAVEIAFAIEDKYKKEVSNDALTGIKTVNDIVKMVMNILK